jgi:hypothetical protein
MKILHPYVNLRVEDQAETWMALSEIRQRYSVIDACLCSCKGDRNFEYDKFLAEHWGTDDLIIVEMDIVAQLRHIEGMVSCSRLNCMYGYRIYPDPMNPLSAFDRELGMTYAFGCCKIMRELQEQLPLSEWYCKGAWGNLDARIQQKLNVKFGQPHLHTDEVLRHNHFRREWERS